MSNVTARTTTTSTLIQKYLLQQLELAKHLMTSTTNFIAPGPWKLLLLLQKCKNLQYVCNNHAYKLVKAIFSFHVAKYHYQVIKNDCSILYTQCNTWDVESHVGK